MSSIAFARRVFCSFLIAAALLLIASAPAQGQAAPSLIPYTVSVFAGGGPTATYAKNSLCPVSGNVEQDKYGDGCLATELVLKNPHYTTEDIYGNYYFSDPGYGKYDGVIRRIDGVTGVVTLVAGGASEPTVGTACPSGDIPSSIEGDGCLSSEADITYPAGLAFSPLTGYLYFADAYGSVHYIIPTGSCSTVTNALPCFTQTSSTGVMQIAAGNAAGYGYFIGDPAASPVRFQVAETGTASTSSYMNEPVGLSFDLSGDLYINDEYKGAMYALNTNTTGSTTPEFGVTLPAGDITKLVGAQSASVFVCTEAVSGASCTYPNPAPAYSGLSYDEEVDAPLDTVVDSNGNIYFAEYYEYSVAKITSSTGVVSAYAGERAATIGKVVTATGAATSTSMGSPMGLSLDPSNNMYITDASNGFLWRVDYVTGNMVAIGGGATATYSAGTACAIQPLSATSTVNSSDAYGDGCPARAAEFSNNAGARTTTASIETPVFVEGGYLDSYGNLIVQDAGHSLIRKLASGTQFGRVVGSPTQYLDVHFGVNDTPMSSQSLAYVATTTTPVGSPTVAPVFQTGTAVCGSANLDGTMDCILPLKIIGTTSGSFTGTLTVTSTAGKITPFPLSVTIVVPVASNTAVSVAGTCPPGGSSTVTVVVTNPVSQPGNGTVALYVNGSSVASKTLPGSGVVTFPFTFPAGATYTVYATYSGDPDDLASTTATQTTSSFISGVLVGAPGPNSEASVTAGGQALFTVIVSDFSVLSASVPLASVTCSGLPAGASCTAYPQVPLPSLVPPAAGTGCAYGATIALTVTTTQPKPVVYGFGASGKSKWALFSMLPALLLALLVTFRRQRSPLKYSGMLLALLLLLITAGTLGCGNDFGSAAPGTPHGTYPFTVTVVDSSGDIQTISGFSLTVQ